jgi:hypothetical protein
MLAEFDIGQIIFLVVFLVVALVQWVIKTVKEKAEAAEQARRVPTQEEADARRRAWSEQTRPATPPPATSTPPSGGTLEDLIGELRKAFEPARESRPPVRPPPPMPRPAAPAPAAPRLPLSPVTPVASVTVSTTPIVESLHSDRKAHPLTSLLRTEGGYRQAFVLREVLGPPRALHEYHGPD